MRIKVPWASRRLAGRVLLAGGVAAVGSLFLVTSAFASIPDSSGVIHGCYNKHNGELRVIDPASRHCRTREIAIQWNQTGPQGPAGAAGPPGAVWRGVWAPVDTYQKGDAVSFNGSSYIASGTPTKGVSPDTDTANWNLLAAAGAPGAPGSKGDPGQIGPTGPPGPAGVSGYQQLETQFTAPEKSIVEGLTATCPAGEVLLGGGTTLLDTLNPANGDTPVAVMGSGPISSTTWQADLSNPNSRPITWGVWIMCAAVQ